MREWGAGLLQGHGHTNLVMLLQNELAPCAPRVNALALRREGPVDGCQGGEGVGVWGCERMGELDGGDVRGCVCVNGG